MELIPENTAVLAVHLQNDIVGTSGGLTAMFSEQVISQGVLSTAAALLIAARQSAVDVIYTRVAFAPDYSNMQANSPLLRGTAEAQCLKEGTPGAAIASEVAPADGDLVVTHQRIGAFAGTSLESTLRERGVTTLIVFGVATNASVETSARWASDLGFDVIVVEDACSSTSPAAHEASIASLGMVATIATSAEILSALEATR